jgi:hypothetical protein
MTKLYPALYSYFNPLGEILDPPMFSTQLFENVEQAHKILSNSRPDLWIPTDPRGHYKIIRLMTEWPIVNDWELG